MSLRRVGAITWSPDSAGAFLASSALEFGPAHAQRVGVGDLTVLRQENSDHLGQAHLRPDHVLATAPPHPVLAAIQIAPSGVGGLTSRTSTLPGEAPPAGNPASVRLSPASGNSAGRRGSAMRGFPGCCGCLRKRPRLAYGYRRALLPPRACVNGEAIEAGSPRPGVRSFMPSFLSQVLVPAARADAERLQHLHLHPRHDQLHPKSGPKPALVK